MNENQLGPPLVFALFLTGVWIGWRATRLKEGEIPIPTQGFGRGAPKPLRIGAAGFGVALAGVLLRLLSLQLDSLPLAYIAVAIVAVGIGVGWGAAICGLRGFMR
jgi:hypothetical protein